MIIPATAPVSIPIATPTASHAVIPTTESAETRGKEVLVVTVRTKVHPEVIVEASKKEMEEILKIIKKSDYNVVEQLGHTP